MSMSPSCSVHLAIQEEGFVLCLVMATVRSLTSILLISLFIPSSLHHSAGWGKVDSAIPTTLRFHFIVFLMSDWLKWTTSPVGIICPLMLGSFIWSPKPWILPYLMSFSLHSATMSFFFRPLVFGRSPSPLLSLCPTPPGTGSGVPWVKFGGLHW